MIARKTDVSSVKGNLFQMVDRIIYHPVVHEFESDGYRNRLQSFQLTYSGLDVLEILGTAINYKSLLLDFISSGYLGLSFKTSVSAGRFSAGTHS